MFIAWEVLCSNSISTIYRHVEQQFKLYFNLITLLLSLLDISVRGVR